MSTTTETIEAECYGGFADGQVHVVAAGTNTLRVPVPLGPSGVVSSVRFKYYQLDGFTAGGLFRFTLDGMPRWTGGAK